eukprot:GHVU01228374.1.p2 GENE.GHVU01228374.1~~GHVU01228374.1.p2  ORF type:complete len:149 (+),score=17.73 GHVU01228374.1:103-549(+)
MGITGLWDIVAPAGEYVRLESLRGCTVAVDASVWLVQFMKALRGPDGSLPRGAHLIGFFRRICKLLYYDVKPIFIFDGPAPPLKQRTLVARRLARQRNEGNLNRTVEKVLVNRLKKRVVEVSRAASASKAKQTGNKQKKQKQATPPPA